MSHDFALVRIVSLAVERAITHPSPAQIPACGITAPGSSEILASAKALSQARNKLRSFTSGAVYDMGFHNAELGQELIEPIPIIALALAALI